MRVDELTVDEIDPATLAARTVHSASGYLLFLASAAGREILVYRVGPSGADLVAVDPDTGATRTVFASMLPFARDFSVEGGAVVFQERSEVDSRTWTVERVDLASGARSRLYAGPSASLAPFAWPGGGVALSRDGHGLAMLGGRSLAPLGDGVDLVLAVSPDRAWIAGLHTVAGRLPEAFAIDTTSGAPAALPAPAGAQIAVAGFVTGGRQ
jgi:hypothetical protein